MPLRLYSEGSAFVASAPVCRHILLLFIFTGMFLPTTRDDIDAGAAPILFAVYILPDGLTAASIAPMNYAQKRRAMMPRLYARHEQDAHFERRLHLLRC